MSTPVDPTTTPTTAVDPTNYASSDFDETLILNKIFNLIVTMLTSLQNLAVAQSDRLNVLTQWQQSYADLENEVHTFTANNGDGIDGSSSAEMNARDDMNRIASADLQTMQNRNSVLSDTSKSLQSNVSQTNDEVNQQSTLGTSIITTMQTILSAIYH